MVPSLGVSWLGSIAGSDLGLQISGKVPSEFIADGKYSNKKKTEAPQDSNVGTE